MEFVAAYPVLTAVAAGAAAPLVTDALGITGKSKAPAPSAPVLSPPTPMPDEKATRRAAQRSSIAEQLRRRGRASTILTDAVSESTTTDTLGG